MSQHAQEQARRVSLSAFVDAEQRAALGELARREDGSVSSVVRTALARHRARNALCPPCRRCRGHRAGEAQRLRRERLGV